MPIETRTGTEDWTRGKGLFTGFRITPILFNFYLDYLDQAFESRFPEQRYARYAGEIYIPFLMGKDRTKEEFISEFLNLAGEFGLVGNVINLLPGGPPIDVPGGTLLLTREGRVHVISSAFP